MTGRTIPYAMGKRRLQSAEQRVSTRGVNVRWSKVSISTMFPRFRFYIGPPPAERDPLDSATCGTCRRRLLSYQQPKRLETELAAAG
jgi:hypothetical protein